MASIQSLPFDIVYNILDRDDISASDLLRLSSVCKMFNCISNNNALWRNKFARRWPILVERFEAESVNWKLLYKWRYYAERKVRLKISQLIIECYHIQEINHSDWKNFYGIVDEFSQLNTFVMDEIEKVASFPGEERLSEKYYAVRLWRYMKMTSLIAESESFVLKSRGNLSYLDGVCLASKWLEPFSLFSGENGMLEVPFKPHYKPNDDVVVPACIIEIAKKVLSRIKVLYPTNQIVAHGILRSDTIPRSLWSYTECKQILRSIVEIMFMDIKYFEDDQDLDCYLIQKVLVEHRATKFMLSVIFTAVAAKLGVFCYPIIEPVVRFLKFIPNELFVVGDLYIDINAGWEFTTIQRVGSISRGDVETVPTQSSMAFFYLIHQALKFASQTCFRYSVHVHSALKLLECTTVDARILHYSPNILFFFNTIFIQSLSLFLINLPDLVPDGILRRAQISVPVESFPIRHKYRNLAIFSRVKYAVGMIMRHKRYFYRCVIYSWDHAPDRRWLDVYNLNGIQSQAYYRVLLNGDKVYYIAQEDLQIDRENRPIKSTKVGKYFKSYEGAYYSPNDMTTSVYPHDYLTRNALLRIR